MKMNNYKVKWTLKEKLAIWDWIKYRPRYIKENYTQWTIDNDFKIERSEGAINTAISKMNSLLAVGFENVAKYDSVFDLNDNSIGVPAMQYNAFLFCKEIADYLYKNHMEMK